MMIFYENLVKSMFWPFKRKADVLLIPPKKNVVSLDSCFVATGSSSVLSVIFSNSLQYFQIVCNIFKYSAKVLNSFQNFQIVSNIFKLFATFSNVLFKSNLKFNKKYLGNIIVTMS